MPLAPAQASQDPDLARIADIQRRQATAQIAGEILEHERIEEVMVRRLIADGVAVSRRTDAALAAVLEVSVSRF